MNKNDLISAVSSSSGLSKLDAAKAVDAAPGHRDRLDTTGNGDVDAVLLDAPCSNTAVLAGRPGARWRFGPASLRALTELQSRLLACAARRVRPGGRLVYSTCSLEPEEGERMISDWLADNAGWGLEEEHTLSPSTQAGGPVDGGYAARLHWNPK